MRIGVPKSQATELIDNEMRAAFEATLDVLRKEGAQLIEVELPDHLLSRTCMWAISASELAEFHGEWLTTRASDYSPTVLGLIKQGAFCLRRSMSAPSGFGRRSSLLTRR